ncbi:unnamed protein product [marine sediment metagenome]|uniref:Radical SAM core domain-containing protein n=1 Tax=marine sediment metagenome TaxID=412755 RepID=X1HQ67_9ZZZZ
MNYQEENDKLLSDFWENTFFRTWENMSEGFENFQTLELILNTKCDLNCNYCYLAKYGHELYPMSLQKDKLTLANMEAVIILKAAFIVPSTSSW